MRKRHRAQHELQAAAVLLGLWFVWAAAGFAAPLEIHCLDVGQGDCTLVRSPTGGTFLFDAGWNGNGNSVVIPYLQGLGVTGLDYLSASHYHADHIGGLDEVVYSLGMDSIRVAVLDRGWSYTTQTYDDYAAAVAPKRTTITGGQVIDLGGGVTITCVGVNGNGVLSAPFDNKEENDLCVSLHIEYQGFDFFVAGDLSGVNSSYYHDIETGVSGEVGQIEVYRVDHHGSSSNTNSNLVSNMSPEVSIISCGDNSYGHPTQTVINRLVSAGSYIYQTELGDGGTIPSGHGEVVNGHIVIEVHSGYYTVNGDVYTLEGAGVEVAQDAVWFEAFPNPFGSSTALNFDISGARAARVAIYDVSGRLVRAFPELDSSDGLRSVIWDGRALDGREASAGLYFVRVSSPPASIVHKVVKR